MKDIFHQLKIAMAINEESLLGLSRKWDVSDTHIREVARGKNVSEPMRNKILNYIEESKNIVHFSYPTNGQTNGQGLKQENRSLETV